MSAAFGRDVAREASAPHRPVGSRQARRGRRLQRRLHPRRQSRLSGAAGAVPVLHPRRRARQSARPIRERAQDRRSRFSRSFRPTSPKCCAHRSAKCCSARTGPLLWIGAIVGLWTVGKLHRDDPRHPPPGLWREILRAVLGISAGFDGDDRRRGLPPDDRVRLQRGAQLRATCDRALDTDFPECRGCARRSIGSFPALVLFVTVYFLFFLLTPSRYRKRGCRKWPGALLDHRLVAG